MNLAVVRLAASLLLGGLLIVPSSMLAADLKRPTKVEPEQVEPKKVEPKKVEPKPPAAPLAVPPKNGTQTSTAPQTPTIKPIEIDFCKAAKISEERLEAIVAEAVKSGLPNFPLTVLFRNAADECLVDGKVLVAWQGGSSTYTLNSTGRVTVLLSPERVKKLKFAVPPGYTVVRQTSISEAESYQAPSDFGFMNLEVMNDQEIRSHIQRKLVELRERKDFLPMEKATEQLRRTRCTLDLPEPGDEKSSPEELYVKFKPSIVVMAALGKTGQMRISTGVVIRPEGIVLTNHHVVANAKDTVLMGSMLADGRVVPLREILAADRAQDIAIVRIDADDLPCAALSHGEPIGTPVTIISHPNQRFYFLTRGYICRYSRGMHAGEDRAYLEVSAEFMPGSSGGPALAPDGSVAGIVSTISQTDKGMTFKQCVPVQAIRRLIEPVAASTEK